MNRPRIGLVPLARASGDLVRAKAHRAAALAVLDRLEIELTGPRGLLLDAAAMMRAARSLAAYAPDRLLLLQLTATPAPATVRLARAVGSPVVIWSFPGGATVSASWRGATEAAAALERAGIACDHLQMAGDDPAAAERLAELLAAGERHAA